MKTVRRRRQEFKTDYKARFHLLKSGLPRIVVRKSNRYIMVQIIETEVAQDKVIITISSKELLSKGWPKEKVGSLKSLTSAYLTGYLLGKTAKVSSDIVLDMGLNKSIARSRIYAVLKGAIDAGLKISHDKKVLPTEEDLNRNENLKGILTKVKEKI